MGGVHGFQKKRVPRLLAVLVNCLTYVHYVIQKLLCKEKIGSKPKKLLKMAFRDVFTLNLEPLRGFEFF